MNAPKPLGKPLHAVEPALGADDEGTPVSVRIRERLKADRERFHANDNIADYIRPGELQQMLYEVAGKMQGVLDSLVIDTRVMADVQARGASSQMKVASRAGAKYVVFVPAEADGYAVRDMTAGKDEAKLTDLNRLRDWLRNRRRERDASNPRENS